MLLTVVEFDIVAAVAVAILKLFAMELLKVDRNDDIMVKVVAFG